MRLHAAWPLLYDRFAWLFDCVAYCASRGHWRAWGRASLAYLDRGRVLDLGHGPGHLLVALTRHGCQPVGIDRSAQMGRQAGRRLRRAGLAVPLVRCEAQALPFRSGSFDAAIATFPTDDILDPRTLSEVTRVTSASGRLVIVAGAQRRGAVPDPHFLGWLSGIIGQAGERHKGAESIFAQAGLEAQIECKAVGATTVMLIVAEKVPQDLAAIRAEIEAELRGISRLAPTVAPEPVEVGRGV
jgi:ubiquinone/menaquinone biosynthesis C-methylase UbiE